jgi:hypothetical protein
MRYTHEEMVQALNRWAQEEGMDRDELEAAMLTLARLASAEDLLKTFPREIAAYAYPIEGQALVSHLMWTNGTVVCGESQPDRFWVWPWSPFLLTLPEACPTCVADYRSPKKRTLNGAGNTVQSETRAAS